jgi:hypothetical protein
MNIYLPYTYLIGWSKLNKWYYGSRYAKGCHPDDLWKTYFTSSKHVKQFRSEFGDPDIVQIRRTFTDPSKVRLWEDSVLSSIPNQSRSLWLNIKFGTSFKGCSSPGPKHHSDKTKSKLSEAGKSRKLSDEHKRKIGLAHRGRSVSPERLVSLKTQNIGRKHSEETLIKMSVSHKGKTPNKGKVLTEDWRNNIRLSLLGKKRGPYTANNYAGTTVNSVAVSTGSGAL